MVSADPRGVLEGLPNTVTHPCQLELTLTIVNMQTHMESEIAALHFCIMHLLERRIRSKHRWRLCEDALLELGLSENPEGLFRRLEANDSAEP